MNTGNILLINPWIYDFSAYDLWLKPVGLLSVGSFLRAHGYSISLIDCLDRRHPALLKMGRPYTTRDNLYGNGKFYREIVPTPEILRHIPRRFARFGWPLALFQAELDRVPAPAVILVTSGMTYWYPGVFQAIELVKKRWPGVPVILGGIYATLYYTHACQYSNADYVVKGQGEIRALELVDTLTGYTGARSERPQSLDEFPYPAYDLYPNLTAVPILTSRGCPYRCPFCATELLAPEFLQRDPRQVVAEIQYYQQQFGVTEFAFWDDGLLIHPERHFKVILEQLLATHLRGNFHLPNGIHPKEITADIAKLMAACGFKTIRLSFESSNPARQRSMDNKVTNAALVRAVRYLTEAGFRASDLGVYLLMGLPAQSMEEIRESMDFVHQLGVKIRLLSFSPIPGTREWQKALARHQFPADADPLLTNKSTYPLYPAPEKYAAFEELKLLANNLNAALEAPVDLI
ncbi:radical SAM protein [candidate division KSB1 bacterium]|nr:radical SAM protein [candidate division KSB1 bacterium]